MKTLKLFNAVLRKTTSDDPYISEDGYIIESGALWAKDRIIDFYRKEKLNGNDLNKTLHKSWSKIRDSSRFELFLEQITHYISTYGTNFEDEIYIPDEVLDIPDVELRYKVIKAYSNDEMIDKCLNMLKSGVALKEETIDDLLTVLVDELGYEFTGKEGIKNKEAVIKIAAMYGVIPVNVIEFLRYILYRTTDSALLIKNGDTIEAIKESSYNPSVQFKKFGLKKLAEVFNRFKPLFLAYKTKCPSVINRISKLSKKYHKPMIQNPLNLVTSKKLTSNDLHWLDNATIFALFKALNACHLRIQGQKYFIYKIRNGKSWVEEGKINEDIVRYNYSIILDKIKKRINLQGTSFILPNDVEYGLPTSEKMFVGNMPFGTKFYGDKLAVGIYWKNSWGASDIDVSGINVSGKVGWNSKYNQDNELYYSGDITNAPQGAIEYLYANKGLEDTLVNVNIYSGDDDSKYKIVVGKGVNVDKNYMMNPNKVFAQVSAQAIQKQMIAGLLTEIDSRQCFVLLNIGSGQARVSGVSGDSDVSEMLRKALLFEYTNSISLNDIIELSGGKVVSDNADIDLSIDKVSRDTILNIFN